MKKNDFIYPAIFLAIVILILLFVIPVGAFLTAEIVGFKTVKSVGDWIYVFLKDQGSLIAGTLAVLTAFFAIRFERRQFKKNGLERDRRESLDLLFEIQEYSLCLADYLDGGLPFNVGKLSKEDIGKMAPLSRGVLRRTIIIKSYLEDSDHEESMGLVDIVIRQSNLFNNYLNYMRGVDHGALRSTQVSCLNLEVFEIIKMQSNIEKNGRLYPFGLKFNTVELHGHYKNRLSNAWGCISNDISSKLIIALLKK